MTDLTHRSRKLGNTVILLAATPLASSIAIRERLKPAERKDVSRLSQLWNSQPDQAQPVEAFEETPS